MNLSVTLNRKERNWGLIYLLLELLVFPSVLSLVNALFPRPLTETELNAVFFVLNFACVLAIFHRFLWRSLPRTENQLWICLRYAFFGFVLYQVASYLMTLLITLIQPEFMNVNDEAIAGMAQENFFILNICTVLLVPLTEECLFRGLFFLGLQERGKFSSYAVSTVLFSLVHVVGYVGLYDFPTLLLCFIQYLPAGLCLGWAYRKSDTIFAPILMHMTINQLGILSMR